MAANLDMTADRANIAFLGSRADVWHRQGQEMLPDQTIEDWAAAAGLGWRALKVPAHASLIGPEFEHLADRMPRIDDRSFVVRSDTGATLGYVSGESAESGYQIVQPAAVLDWFQRYIAVDDRFALDVCGSLDGGRRIWATAIYNGIIPVAGEEHRARVLMSTTFDGSGSTINQCTMTRVVCSNTMRVSHADTRAQIKTRHNTAFNADQVGRELARLAEGFAVYKTIGDALARVHMTADQVAAFFDKVMAIPPTVPGVKVSTRKSNQVIQLYQALGLSVAEGAAPNTAWAALQAVTRYADHDASVKHGGGDVGTARFNSSQFGNGDALKGRALELLQAA